MLPPPIRAFEWGESAVLSLPEARQAVMGPQVSSPHDYLVWDGCDLDDDDPSCLPVPMRGVFCLPPFARMHVPKATSAVPWPFPYLARPQLLTRSSPLPSGRENPRLSQV